MSEKINLRSVLVQTDSFDLIGVIHDLCSPGEPYFIHNDYG